MIPNLIFILFTFGWALAVQYGIDSSDFIIPVVMVLPFLAIIVPLLLFGLRPPANFLALPLKSTRHAPFPHLIIGTLLSGSSIFYLVLNGNSNSTYIVAGFLLIILGSCFTIYAHKHKVRPKVLV